jgi:hypothetical protein
MKTRIDTSEENHRYYTFHNIVISELPRSTIVATNVLQNRSFGGNLAIKVDITKAFDTLRWSFLLRVLNFWALLYSSFLSMDIVHSKE